MKIVFTDSLLDIIMKRLHEGRAANKKAEYILISEPEYAELRNDRRFYQHFDDGMRAMYTASDMTMMRDATFKTIRLEEPTRGRPGSSPYVNFASHLKFQGVDVYVVPARFM